MNTPRPSAPHSRAFSLIEMIGVLAVMAILAGMLLPNVLRKIADAHSGREDRNLAILADGLLQYTQSRQTIPGASSWASNIAEMTGLNLNEVLRVLPHDANTARVYVIHPAFAPSTGSNPVFTNLSSGASSPTNARLMILSTTKSSLVIPLAGGKASNTAPNRQAFDDVWDWNYSPATKAPPTGWAASWNNNGEHLHVQRVNFAPLFLHVAVSNAQFPTNIPFARINALATIAYSATNAVDGYFLRGTTLRLYKHDSPYAGPPANPDDLDLAHTLERDVNFFYSGSPPQWIVP
jgi:prepilin-type N-terminal cleavage/methylation domain-containing protein